MKKRSLIVLIIFLFNSSMALAIEQSLLLKLLELRRESYLSKKGEIQLDLVPTYSQDYDIFPWTVVKNSSYNLNAHLRVGLSNLVEANLTLPFSSLLRERFEGISWETYQALGICDPSVSLQIELLQERINRPAVYFIVGTRIPMGRSTYDNLNNNEIPLGSGHFATNWGFSFLKSIDPCVIYWGIDYLWTLRRSDYDPADIISYNGGLAFSLNQQVNLSLGVLGTVVGESKLSGQSISGAYDTIAFSIGTTIIFSPNLYFNPTVTFGLDNEDNDFLFSLGLSFKK